VVAGVQGPGDLVLRGGAQVVPQGSQASLLEQGLSSVVLPGLELLPIREGRQWPGRELIGKAVQVLLQVHGVIS